MRRHLPLLSLISGSLLLTQSLLAQDAGQRIYAITDAPNQLNNWSQLRTLSPGGKGYSNSLMDGLSAQQTALDAYTRKPFVAKAPYNQMGFPEQPAFSSGVAALALDPRNNRLYYTPMFIDQLRYIDLKTLQVYYVDLPFTGKPLKSSDQGNIVTRMVIASDGNGYAMTNDGSQLIRFTTGKRPGITDLGRIADDPANKDVSIHSSCSSYGGDMIADDDGNLYVFSARNQVFRINTETKVATHLGMVTGLPAGFSINGAAVIEGNKVLVASAAESASLFVVDPAGWTAKAYPLSSPIWHTSDLATGLLLASGRKPDATTVDVVSTPAEISGTGKIGIFPNPVTDNRFVLQFGKLEAGNYTIQVTDVMGRQVLQQQVISSGENHAQRISLPSSASKGVYLVKVLDAGSKTAFSAKIVVQ